VLFLVEGIRAVDGAVFVFTRPPGAWYRAGELFFPSAGVFGLDHTCLVHTHTHTLDRRISIPCLATAIYYATASAFSSTNSLRAPPLLQAYRPLQQTVTL